MNMQRERLRHLLVVAAAVVGVAVTASLGRWQLSRAAQKEQIQADIVARQALPPLSPTQWQAVLASHAAGADDAAWASIHHRQASVQGQWVPEATVYLDNRPLDGRAGFIVVTPLRLEPDGRVLPIQRGWLPRDATDRTRVPELPTPTGRVTVQGRLAPPPSRMYELGADQAGRIRQNLDLPRLSAELKAEVLPLSLLQSPDSGGADGAGPDGLTRSWPITFPDVHKHHGYAFQWFGLSTLIVVLYVWFQIILPRRRAR